MRLLVSVRNATEALAAVQGGADLVDVKDPNAGSLGAAPIKDFHKIHTAVSGERPVTAALGDANDETAIEKIARTFADAGAAIVKVGFAGIDNARPGPNADRGRHPRGSSRRQRNCRGDGRIRG